MNKQTEDEKINKPDPIHNIWEYKERLKQYRKKKYFKIFGLAGICIIMLFLVWQISLHWEFKDYRVLSHQEHEDAVSANYVEFGNNILKYGNDEVALLDRQGTAIWQASHYTDHPMIDMCGEYCVIYDKKGTKMSVYNVQGKVSDIQLAHPILKAKIAKQGVISVILEDGETTWINVYDSKGEEIVTSKTRVDSPGYPVDLSISEDGVLLGVTYFCVKNNKPSSYVAFYNFGNTGQNQMDNLVSGYTYIDKLIPQIECLGSGKMVAFGDDGFIVYDGKQIPEEIETVQVEQEIIATFHSADQIGIVVQTVGEEYPYHMQVYNRNGKLLWDQGLDLSYNKIEISKEQILVYNSTEFAIYDMDGTKRFQGALKEGYLKKMIKVAKNRYMLVMEHGLQMIKLG